MAVFKPTAKATWKDSSSKAAHIAADLGSIAIHTIWNLNYSI
jgi:hypothetical protein